MFDAGVGTDALGGPIMDMERAVGAGVSTGAALLPAASIRFVVFLTEVLAVMFAFALNKVGTGGGGCTTAVAGVTVTQVPLNVPAVVQAPTSVLGLNENDAGRTARLETDNLCKRKTASVTIKEQMFVCRIRRTQSLEKWSDWPSEQAE